MTTKLIDLTGQKFGRLTVLSRKGSKNGNATWECICSCENQTIKLVRSYLLIHGGSRSCGCLIKEIHTKHGGAVRGKKNKIYRAWSAMKQRCLNSNCRLYKNYGGRGITVCQEWIEPKGQGFINFQNWAVENEHSNDLSLDRIDVNGNYEPNNCRWATRIEQSTNMQSTVRMFFNGQLMDTTTIYYSANPPPVIMYDTFMRRIKLLGMNVNDALYSPPKSKGFRGR